MIKWLRACIFLIGSVFQGGNAFAPPVVGGSRTRLSLRINHCRQQPNQRHIHDIHSYTQLFLDTQDDGQPDPSILISSKDETTQQLAVVASFAALAVGTAACVNLWHGPGKALTEALMGPSGFENICSTIFPIVFGIIFAVVGVLHFVAKDNFVLITPPRGTWGFWQAPAPFAEQLGVTYEEYHVYWSGIVEFLGGLWLLAGGLGLTHTQAPAILLFLLTVAVTPANLYMFTHDAHPGESIPRLAYPAGHIARFVLQCGLLSNFWIMAFS